MDAFGNHNYCPNCGSQSISGNHRMVCSNCEVEFKPIEFVKPVLLKELLDLCNENQPGHSKIQAIKLLRDVFMLGLKDAKTCIDVIYDIINDQKKYVVIYKYDFNQQLEEEKRLAREKQDY